MMDGLLKKNNFRYGVLCLILLTGLFIRTYHQDLYTYGSDQAMHIEISEGHSLGEVWQFSKNETHPPLDYFMHYFWMKISHDITWNYALGFIYDTITILLFYLVGNKLHPGCGLIAALLAALCPTMVTMSQLIRSNSIFLMFMMGGLYSFLQWMETRQEKWLALYVLTGCLMVASHFSAIIPLTAMGSVALYHFGREKNWRLACLWIIGNGIVALLLLFFYLQISWTIFVYALPKTSFIVSLQNIIPQFILLLVDYLPYYLPNFTDQLPDLLKHDKLSYMIISNLTKGLFVYFIYPILIESRKTQPLIFQITIAGVAVLLVLCLFQCYDTVPRHNIWIAPFIILPCAIWLYQKVKLYPVIFTMLAVSTILIPFHDDQYRKNDETMTRAEIDEWRHYIKDHVEPGDIIVGGRNAIIIFYEHMLGRNYYRELPVLNDKSYYTRNHIDIRNSEMLAMDEAGRAYISPAYEFTLMTPEDFDIFFKNVIEKNELKDAHHIWFLSAFDANEHLAEHLAACPALKNEIQDRFIHPGDRVLFFGLPKADLPEIIKPDGKFRSCLQP